MADRTHEETSISAAWWRRTASFALFLAASFAQAAERSPLEVIVTPDAGLASYTSAMNETGVVEANSARIDNGIVYLEYDAAPGTADAALTAAAR